MQMMDEGPMGTQNTAASAMEISVFPMGLREFRLFRSLVHEHAGIWLRDGKQIMLASRLSRRLRHHGLANFVEYYDFIQASLDNRAEIRELINCVTTNKTSFFRERHHFEFLAKTVVPQIQSSYRSGSPRKIRVWSAACSTGEEPYSIAITLLEALSSAKAATRADLAARRASLRGTATPPGSWSIEVVASDIDTAVLAAATRAIYREDSLATVDTPLQHKYFLRGTDDMQGFVKIKPSVARLVQFKHINLVDALWPLDGLFDVIFFRNALIYFNKETQDIFLRKMARILKPNGYLFLGNSEHIPWLSNILAPLTQTMYQLKSVAR
jgi:chemotaxis protein methyltransferase CheR